MPCPLHHFSDGAALHRIDVTDGSRQWSPDSTSGRGASLDDPWQGKSRLGENLLLHVTIRHQFYKAYIMEKDPFDSVLGLEDKFYDEGYKLGEADGTRAGHVEGRLFGLERGFENFVEMGLLHGRSMVWASRLPHTQKQDSRVTPVKEGQDPEEMVPMRENTATADPLLPRLPENLRLEKHLRTLHALVELDSLSTQNAEEDVAEFDDRLKRALGKAKVIGKLIGEEPDVGAASSAEDRVHGVDAQTSSQNQGESSIEDISVLHARH